MRFVPLDEAEQPSSDGRELTFIPLETSEVEQDVSRPAAPKEPEGGVGKLLSNSFGAGLDGVEDMAPEPISRLVKAVRGKPIKSRNGSVLETEQLDPKGDYNANELARLSQRAYAESTDPANPRSSAPSMKEAKAPLVTASQDGIIGRSADLVGAQFRGTAAGAMRAGADVASAFGDNPVSETLRQTSAGTSQIANEKQQRVSLRADQEGFVGEYLPQVLAQLPQVGIALLSGGITLPSVFSGMSAYAEARERGIDPLKATEYAISMGGAEAIGEKLGGTGKLVDAFESAFKAGFTKNAVAAVGQAAMRNGLMELPSEQVTNALQFGLEAGYGINPNPTPEQFIERAKDTAIISVGAGGMVGGAGGIATVAARPRSDQEEVARALAGELSGRDFDPATAGKAADLIFGTRSVDGSGVNRTGAALVEAERAKLNAMRTKASEDLGAAPDVDSAIAAAETMVSLPATGPVEEFVTAPHAASATLANPVPVPSSDTLEAFVNQTLQNAPAETAADAAALNPNDTGAAPAVRATDAGVGGALPQPAGVSVADTPVQSGQSDTPSSVTFPNYGTGRTPIQSTQADPALREAEVRAQTEQQLRVAQERARMSGRDLGPIPKLGAPDERLASAAREIASALGEIAGSVEMVPFADQTNNAVNGFEFGGRIYLNVGQAATNVLNTSLHEFGHVVERIAEAQAARGVKTSSAIRFNDRLNSIFDMMSEDGKRAYADEFLFAGELRGLKGQVREAKLAELMRDRAQTLRSEMTRDFLGNRATDREWLEKLRAADPVGFKGFIAKWVKLIDDIIKELRGKGGNRQSRLVDTYIKDLEKAKQIALEAMVDLNRGDDLQPEGDGTMRASAQEGGRRGVVAEVAPNPDQKEVAADWKEMTAAEQQQTTRSVANRIMPKMFDLMGLRGWSFEFASGTFEGAINANILIDAPAGATLSQIDEVARVAGYVLDQKAMVAFDESNTTSDSQAGFIKVVLPRQMSTAQVDSLRQFISSKVPQAEGDTLRDGSIVYGNFSAYNDNIETLTDEQFGDAIAAAVGEFGWDGEQIKVAAPEVFHSDYIQPDSRDAYLERTRYGEGSQVQTGSSERGDDLRGRQGRDFAQLQELANEAIALRDRWIGARAAARGRSAGDSQAANGAREVGKPEREYGTARDGAVSAVGVHFSQERRSRITSTLFGKGLKGLERERLTDPANSDIKPRINFYVSNGRGVIPEAGVGGITHTVKLNNLYPVKADPLKLVKNMKGATSAERASFFERSVMQAGFDGYLDNNTGGAQDFAVLIGKHDIDMPRYSLGSKDAKPQESFYDQYRRFRNDGRRVDDDTLLEWLGRKGGDASPERWGYIVDRGRDISLATAYWRGAVAGEEGYYTTGVVMRVGGRPTFVMALMPESALVDGSPDDVVRAFKAGKYAWYLTAKETRAGLWEVGTDGAPPGTFYHDKMVESGELEPVRADYFALKMKGGTPSSALLREGARRLSMFLDGQTPAIEFSRMTGARPRAEKTTWPPERIEARFSRNDFVESPDDINDLGAFNIDTFDFDAKTDEVIDGDSMADIANELTEAGFGVSGVTASKPTDWKKVPDKALKGLTPEAAFPMPDFAENEYGNMTAPVYAGGTQVRLELQPYGLKDEDLWTAAIGGLRIDADWGTPLSMRGAGRKEAADYLQRMAAAKELTYRKFDFYKAVPAPAAKRIGEFWSAVPDIPGATEFAAGTPEVDGNSAEKLRQIAKARLLGKGYSVQVNSTADFFFMYFQNEKTGDVDEASIQIIGKPRDVGQQSVVLHAVTLNKGSGVGKMFYSIANTWANVVGVKVLADPDGLTAVNSVRRTENALSAAARTKGEAMIEPGWAQRVYGFDGKAKTPDSKRKNLTRIALAQARNVYELAPDFDGVRYDLDTQTFVNEDGTAADPKVKTIMSRPEVRRFSLGRTSFIRAALTNELVDGEIALPEEMGEPIMYSRAQLDSYMEGRNKTMPTISGAAAQEADIDLAVKAIEAVRAEIERGKRDSLPIPIGRTPHVLNMLGARQKMLRIDTGILRKVLFDKHSEDFADVTPERFVRSIYMPAMVLRGRAVNEYEIVTSIVTPRGPIMVPVTDSGNSFAVMSAYAKNVGGGGESLVNRIKGGALLYADPAMAQVALTGRESAPVRGIITSGAQFPSAPPQSAQDSNVSQTDISVKPLNPYYVGWDKVRGDIIGGISSRKVKTDIDLMRRIGNLFRGDWEDAPSFSRNSLGLYSALERGLESLTANSAPANGWKDAIKGLVNKGVAKADEVEWSGVNDWLDLQAGKVTKDSVLEYLRGNGVQVEEVVLGQPSEADIEMLLNDEAGEGMSREDAIEYLSNDEGATPPKYDRFTLPGGENYREVLLTLPERTGPSPNTVAMEMFGRRMNDLGPVDQEKVRAKLRETERANYKSSHWDDPNVIAHIRVDDRTDVDGRRVLFVEEIQSDWGQEGKKKGFASKPATPELQSLIDERDRLIRESDAATDPAEGMRIRMGVPALNARITAMGGVVTGSGGASSGIPAAPFVTKTDGWLNLALKRVIAMAVDGGYDAVAFVNGDQSAKRYDLSKQISKVRYDDANSGGVGNPDLNAEEGSGQLYAYNNDGNLVIDKRVQASELEDYVGKEVASRLLASKPNAVRQYGLGVRRRELSGLELKVGGEGMKTFYDQIVPNAVKALLKKVGGGQMSRVTLVLNENMRSRVAPADAGTSEDNGRGFWLGSKGRAWEDQPGFTITDTMSEKVSTEGLPMFSRAQPRQGQNFALPGETRLSQTRRVLQDYFLPVLEVQRAITQQGGSITEASNVYRAEERMYGRVEETLRDFRQREFDPLIQEAIDNDITMDELSLYAYAKHAKERNAYIQTLRRDMPDTGSGLSNDEADDILTMFQVNGQTAIMERLHQRLMGITATTRREMLESELITQDEYDQMESQYANYVPLRGFEEVDQNGERTSVQRGGRGFNIRGKETTRALGRRTRAGNIIENIVLDYERAVFRGERNMVGQTFLELIRTNPDPKLWEIDAERTRVSFNRQTGRVNKSREVDSGPNTVAIKVKGREVYVKVYDERLLRAMRKASKDDTGAIEHFINSTAGQFTALLRATLTQYNPVFAFVNAIRDIQSGGVAVLDELGAKGVALYAKHYRAALAASGRHQLGRLDPSGAKGVFFGDPAMDRYFEEYRAAGGTTGGYYGKSAEDVQQEIRNVLLAAGASPKTFAEKLKTVGGTSAGRRIMRGVQSTGKVLEFLGATSENAARVAAYRAARELGKSPAESASIAKNLTTNFNRKGEWGQAINGAYLFFNAAIQGSHRTLKALKRGRVQALMAGMTATGMASVMLALAVGGDDEDDGQPYWDKIPTFEKERNFIIMLPPGSDMDGTEKVGSNGRYIKIPMPYGFNVFPMLGVQIADVIRNAKDETHGVTPGRGAINMLNAIMGSYNPLGGAIDLEDGKRASSVMQAVFPTIGDIIVQQSLGVDGFSRPTSPFKSEFDLDPDSENANVRQAGSVWHMLARSLNTATGGSQAEPGAIDVSPGSLQNLWKNMTGGTGTFLSDVFVNLPTKFFEPEAEITSRDVPLLRNFYGQVDGMNDQSLLYERRREIQRAKTYEKNRADLDMEPTTDPTEVALASLASLSSKFTKEMSKLRREEIDIADDAEMSTAQKNARKKEIKLERDRLAREFNASYMDAMRAKRDGEFDQ